jgi:hypothetical protein
MTARRYTVWMIVFIVLSVLGTPVAAQGDTHRVVYDGIGFTFAASLATGLQIETIEGVPYSEDMHQCSIYPLHIRFSFVNYLDGRAYRLPYPLTAPQILVYPTEAMSEFGYEYSQQLDALDTLLDERPDLSAYSGATVRLPEVRLPFLPWVNSAQMLRSHPLYVETTDGGSGIRYVTRYSQEADHIHDPQLFYTFQGIVGGGAYYVSAIFPVRTGVLPEEADARDIDWDAFGAAYISYLEEAFEQIDSLSDEDFAPSLNTLDVLVQSLSMMASEAE